MKKNALTARFRTLDPFFRIIVETPSSPEFRHTTFTEKITSHQKLKSGFHTKTSSHPEPPAVRPTFSWLTAGAHIT
jgi:hypothetical protein